MRTAAAITRDILVAAIWMAVLLVSAAFFTVVFDGLYAALGLSPLASTITTMTLAILLATVAAALSWVGVQHLRAWSSSRRERSESQTAASFANIA